MQLGRLVFSLEFERERKKKKKKKMKVLLFIVFVSTLPCGGARKRAWLALEHFETNDNLQKTHSQFDKGKIIFETEQKSVGKESIISNDVKMAAAVESLKKEEDDAKLLSSITNDESEPTSMDNNCNCSSIHPQIDGKSLHKNSVCKMLIFCCVLLALFV